MLGFGLARKLIGKIISLAVTVVIVGALLFVFSPGNVIKKGLASGGPKVTGTSLQVADASISWLTGKGEVKGLLLGSPEGFKAGSAVEIPVAVVAIRPTTVFSDKLVIKSIEVDTPFITYEGSLAGSNLTRIQENIAAFVDRLPKAGGPATGASGGKKLQVDEIVIRNAKVKLALTVLGGRGANISLPEIRLTNLGQGPDGITGAEILKVVWDNLVKATTEKVAGPLGGFGTDVLNAGEKVLKGIGGLFNKDKK